MTESTINYPGGNPVSFLTGVSTGQIRMVMLLSAPLPSKTVPLSSSSFLPSANGTAVLALKAVPAPGSPAVVQYMSVWDTPAATGQNGSLAVSGLSGALASNAAMMLTLNPCVYAYYLTTSTANPSTGTVVNSAATSACPGGGGGGSHKMLYYVGGAVLALLVILAIVYYSRHNNSGNPY